MGIGVRTENVSAVTSHRDTASLSSTVQSSATVTFIWKVLAPHCLCGIPPFNKSARISDRQAMEVGHSHLGSIPFSGSPNTSSHSMLSKICA
jgi:hypothetical protein